MMAACPACAAAPAALELAQTANAIQLSVPSVRCAACISAIESHLAQVQGVVSARVNLTQKRVQIVTDLPASKMVEALKQVGYDAYPLDSRALANDVDAEGRNLLMRMGVAGFAMMNVMLLSVAVWSGASGATRDLFHLISAMIAIPMVLYAAQPFFQNACSALKVGRLNMDVPISLAILLASGMSLFETLMGGEHAYFDAALSLTFFLLIGRYLEHRTRSAAHSAAKELAALEAHTAERRTETGSETVPIEALKVGDVVLVASGMRVPADGLLVTPQGITDRSLLTGESEPVSHAAFDQLHAGEFNLAGPIGVKVSAVGQDTRLHQIARLVETAENARNRYTSLADRAAQIYAPAVHLLALVTFAGWFFWTQDVRHALNIAIAVLIITCPCALGLAVPAVSTAAISRLYRLGFLVKSGTALERLAEVKTIVMDKTGTLTSPDFSFDLSDFGAQDLRIAKALAQVSAHPLSQALNTYLSDHTPAELTDLREENGCGVLGVFGQTPVALGKADWIGAGDTGLCLKIGDDVHALPFQEPLRTGVPEMVQGLQTSAFKLQVLSGDTQAKTRKLANALGLSRFRSEISPEDKSAYIEGITDKAQFPCMIGDGLNDTVALASAHASIAPGAALDAARNAADVIVIDDTMEKIPQVFAISRKAVALSRQNFGIAIAYNAVAVPIAILGYATPLAAALAMSLSSITVLINAARVGYGK
jgi:Cu2+-exporting ATPase